MMMTIKIMFLFFILGFCLSKELSAELLKEQDPQIKKLLVGEKLKKQLKMSLYYQGMEDNYLIFYDFRRDTLYLQYRIDAYDYDQNHIIKRMKRGLFYEVEFEYLGEVDSLPPSILKATEAKKKPEDPEATSDQAQKEQKTKEEEKEPVKLQEPPPLKREKTLSVGKFLTIEPAYLDKLIY